MPYRLSPELTEVSKNLADYRQLRMLLRVLFASLLIGPGARTGLAQGVEGTTFTFLRLETSARISAMAGSYAATTQGDPTIMFYNPALLNENMHRSLSLSYLNHLNDLNAGFISYGHVFDGLGVFSAGIRFLTWGSVDETDESGEVTGSFGASDVAITLSHARSYDDRIRYGGSVHFIHSGIAEARAQAVAFDAGIIYEIPVQQIAIAASLRNYGRVLTSFGISRDQLPVDLNLSISKRLMHIPLLLSVTGSNLHEPLSLDNVSALQNVMNHVAIGGEFQFSPAFNVRLGYNHRLHEQLKMSSRLDFAGIGMGFGLQIRAFALDYSYNSWSSMGGLHQFTLGTSL